MNMADDNSKVKKGKVYNYETQQKDEVDGIYQPRGSLVTMGLPISTRP